MKKKSISNLRLNKKSISNFEQDKQVIGGGRTVHNCSHLLTCPLGICYPTDD